MKKLISLLLLVMCVALGASAETKCKAMTKKGARCTRVAKINGYCKQHYKMQYGKESEKTINGKKRCKAATLKGTQCKNNALPGIDFCTTHETNHDIYDGSNQPRVNPNAPEKATTDAERCQAPTKKGTRCKLKVVDGSKFCNIHKK